MSKLIFSRLHLNLPTKETLKKPFIIDGIRSAAAEGYLNYAYKIVEIETEGDYIKGYLTKYDPYGRGEYVDENTDEIKQGGTVNSVVAKSLFIINVKEMIIAYQVTGNHISKQMFIRMFTKLFETNHEGKDFEFSISSITTQYSFIEKVRTLKNIKKVIISLVPSNPANHDLWADVDERLQENNISKYKEIQETNSEKGITIDDKTYAKMAMSEDGYGIATVDGEDIEGRPVKITTKESEKEISQKYSPNIETKPFKEIINFFSRTFNLISERTTHKDEKKN